MKIVSFCAQLQVFHQFLSQHGRRTFCLPLHKNLPCWSDVCGHMCLCWKCLDAAFCFNHLLAIKSKHTLPAANCCTQKQIVGVFQEPGLVCLSSNERCVYENEHQLSGFRWSTMSRLVKTIIIQLRTDCWLTTVGFKWTVHPSVKFWVQVLNCVQLTSFEHFQLLLINSCLSYREGNFLFFFFKLWRKPRYLCSEKCG